jgi:inositol transport system ATP-binding protein
MSESEYVVEMKGIVKEFPGVKALDGVNLAVKKGEVHSLLGENGAGKSTLMKVLLGIYKQDEGEIFYKGQPVKIANPADALKIGISMIHQEISLVTDRTIAENVWIGREPTTKLGLLDWKKLYQMTEQLFNELDLAGFNPKTLVRRLSVAQQQMVEIARALSYNSDVIIMDEPTSALTEAEVEILFRIINDLKKRGISIIYISHKMDEIFRISDSITVLRDGQWVATRPAKEMDSAKVISLMVGRELSQVFPKVEVAIGEPILEVKNLTRHGYFEDISFSVRKGEILGLSGLMGAGRSEVMRAIFGVDKLDSGEIYFGGKRVHIHSTKDAINLGMGFVTEDRKELGLILCRSVRENVTYASLDSLSTGPFTNMKHEIKATKDMIHKLSIKTPTYKKRVGALSGGNQQKVVLANWLLSKPKVLILDEPTRGIDVGAKYEIHKMMCEFAGQGMAVIMISSELPEILGMSDRIIVMHEGKQKAEFMRGEATQEKILHSAVGVSK